MAVDNFNGYELCGKTIRVDHVFWNNVKVKDFKLPNEYLEIDESDPNYLDKFYKPSGPDGRGWG